MNTLCKFAILSCLSLMFAISISAVVLVQDDFNYPLGPIEGQSGGFGWNGSWSASDDATSVTLEPEAFMLISDSGHSLPLNSLRIVPGTGTAELRRTLASSFTLNPAHETTLYFSLYFSRTDTTPGLSEQLSFLFLRDGRGRPIVSFGANSMEGLTLSLSEATTGVHASAVTEQNNIYRLGRDFGHAPQYWVLGKMVLRPEGNQDEFYLSLFDVEQPIPSDEPSEWDLFLRADAAGTVQKVFFTAGAGSGAVNLSDFWMGTRYRDVVGSSIVERPISALAPAQTDTVPSPATGLRAITDPSPVTPTIRNIWLEKHEAYNRIARQGGVDLLFLGDSITEGWRYRGEAPLVWREYYGTRRAVNFGIGGDRVEHLLWRVINGDWRNISPKLVVILIGTNNVSSDAPSDIVQGILAVTNEVHRKLPESQVLLMAVFPRDEQPDSAFRHSVLEINHELASSPLPENVEYLDIGDKFLKSDGVLPKSLFYDELHPTRQAHEIWAESLEPYVKRYVDEQ